MPTKPQKVNRDNKILNKESPQTHFIAYGLMI